jgi:undecaprenyl-diphosphatase
MVVPLILGKMTLDMKDLAEGGIVLENGSGLIVGFIAAFITGWWACRWMISLVKQARLRYFGYYCLLVGAAALIVQWI